MENGYWDSLPMPGDLQVVVLMGGLGSRLGKEAGKRPKALADVNGTPFFDYQLRLLISYGFRKFLFLVGHMAEQIEEHYRDGSGYGVNIAYSYDGEKLLGTGGAVGRAYEKLEEDFLLLYGDSFMDVDYRETIYRYFRGKRMGCHALMTVMENDDSLERSNVIYKEGRILLYDKCSQKAGMHYVDYGVGMFGKHLFRDCGGESFFDMADLQKRLSLEGKLAAQEVTRRFYEIGHPESLLEFKQYAKRRFGQPQKAVFLDRDGVINNIVYREETEQLDSPLKKNEAELTEGAADAMKILRQEGYYLFIVTNQPAAAKGKAILADLYDVNTYLGKLLKENGVFIDGVEICPHYPEASAHVQERFLIGNCRCRKPGTGMVDALAGRFSLDRGESWMVGDSYTDILAGRKAGLRTAFIGNYKCDACRCLRYEKPDMICRSLADFTYRVKERKI